MTTHAPTPPAPEADGGLRVPSATAPGVSALPPAVVTVAMFPAVAHAVRALVELGVVDLLADGARDVAGLARTCGALERPLRQVLRTAATTGLLSSTRLTDDPTHDPTDGFALTEAGRCLVSGHPSAARDLVTTQLSPVFQESLLRLTETLRTGRSGVQLAQDRTIVDHYADHPDDYASFGRMMIAWYGDTPAAVAEAYAFGAARVVDVGGGIGTLLAAVLDRHPRASGVLFDTAPVIAQAEQAGARRPPGARWTAQAGDFFADVPAGGDVYLLSHVVHDWDDEHSVQILTRCADAARVSGPDARVLVVEELVPEGDEASAAKMLDVVLASLFSGSERTVAQYEQLFAAAGLRLARVVPTASTVSVLEAVPAGSTTAPAGSEGTAP